VQQYSRQQRGYGRGNTRAKYAANCIQIHFFRGNICGYIRGYSCGYTRGYFRGYTRGYGRGYGRGYCAAN
jgi:hypothetical protein